MAKNISYKVLMGIDYAGGRVEIGDTVSDLPQKAIADLLLIGAIEPLDGKVEIVAPVVEETIEEVVEPVKEIPAVEETEEA